MPPDDWDDDTKPPQLIRSVADAVDALFNKARGSVNASMVALAERDKELETLRRLVDQTRKAGDAVARAKDQQIALLETANELLREELRKRGP